MMTYLEGLFVMLFIGTLTWIVSVWRKDVSIVDSIWSLMFIAVGIVYFYDQNDIGLRQIIILFLLLIWGLRLSIHLTWRNWGEPEDRRYQLIREKYQPHFAFKSLLIIFVFQAMLAWIISMPINPALSSSHLTLWDYAGMMLWLVGMSFEVIADWQLARFKTNPSNRKMVLD